MTVVLDADILLRCVGTTAPLHPVAVSALNIPRGRGHSPRTVPHRLYELWVVATRPIASNGFALAPGECDQVSNDLLAAFPLLDDRPGLFAEWRTLVTTHACQGKPAHDARAVAAMNTHGVTRTLTFNGDDFARSPPITALDPHAVAASAAPPPSVTP